jgi:apolipoprotein N-acyltransferase
MTHADVTMDRLTATPEDKPVPVGWLERLVRNSWQRRLAYALLGAIAALGLPPLDAVWITVPALSLVLVLETRVPRARLWRPLVDGFLFGFGYFCVALHWISYAFLVDAATYLWMMPFAVGGLSLLMAAYWGLGFWLAEIFARRGFARWVTLAATLSLFEMLRGYLFTGFPWAAPGLMADASLPLLQLASLIGMPGLTALVLLWGFAPAAFWLSRKGLVIDRVLPMLLLASLPLAWVWGQQRLDNQAITDGSRPLVRLVQPNISQSDKWRADNASAIFDTLLTLSAQPAARTPDVIIWPESAVPFLLAENQEALQRIARMLEPGQTLLTGAIRRDAQEHYFTSILMINDAGEVIDAYDKWRLVPGGEFLPLAWVLEPLGFRKVVSLPEPFSAGEGANSLAVPAAGKALMLICYEAIFPFGLMPQGTRPDWIVNVTNDGWFGNSTGPWQHLAQTRMRAVEQGLPLARAANTGISAMIDGHGVVIAQSKLETETVLDQLLPRALASTVFATWGLTASLGFVFLLLAIGGYPIFTKRRIL